MTLNKINNTKKSIFIFSVNYPFSHGEHLLEKEINHLKKEFNEITIICSDLHSDQNYKVNDDIKVFRYKPKITIKDLIFQSNLFLTSIFINELVIILRKYKISDTLNLLKRAYFALISAKKYEVFIKNIINDKKDVYLYSWWLTNATIAFSLLKKQFPKVKVCSRARAVDLYLYRHNPPYLPLRNFIFQSLDKIFTISGEGKNYILNEFKGNDKNKIQISPDGIQNNFERRQYNYEKPFTIVSCSNLLELKRIDYLIDSIALIDKHEINWLHFGDGELKDKLINYAEDKLNTKRNISFEFLGHFRNNELMKYYSKIRIDLFINLSEYEGVPVSIMEAFSFGVPAIATDVGGVSEIVNKENGFLIPVERDPLLVKHIIEKYIELPLESKIKYRDAAYNTWKNKYNADVNFDKISKSIMEIA